MTIGFEWNFTIIFQRFYFISIKILDDWISEKLSNKVKKLLYGNCINFLINFLIYLFKIIFFIFLALFKIFLTSINKVISLIIILFSNFDFNHYYYSWERANSLNLIIHYIILTKSYNIFYISGSHLAFSLNPPLRRISQNASYLAFHLPLSEQGRIRVLYILFMFWS